MQGFDYVKARGDLDIPTEHVISIYKDYLTMPRMSKIISILNKHMRSIPAFITWFEYIGKNNVRVKDITKAIDYIKDMQSPSNKQNLKNEINQRGFTCEKDWHNQKLIT